MLLSEACRRRHSRSDRPGRDRRKIGQTGTYPVIEDSPGLIATVQIGVLELHPWGSTVAKLETPDRITFDLDPDIGLPWERVTEAAIEMRETLLGIGLKSFPKTTGGKGLHVVVPIAPKLDWDQAKEFSKWVAERFIAAYPDHFTSNMAKRARAGRIFIDYLRNSRGATAIAAYSPRRGRTPRSRRRCPGRKSRTASSRTVSPSRPCRSGWPGSGPIPGPRCARCASRSAPRAPRSRDLTRHRLLSRGRESPLSAPQEGEGGAQRASAGRVRWARAAAPNSPGPRPSPSPPLGERGCTNLRILLLAALQELAADLDPRLAVILDDVGGGVGLGPDLRAGRSRCRPRRSAPWLPP